MHSTQDVRSSLTIVRYFKREYTWDDGGWLRSQLLVAESPDGPWQELTTRAPDTWWMPDA